MNIINPMKNLHIATIGEDFAHWVKKTQSGLELDQFCMAENLDEPKYESCCKEIRRLFTDCIRRLSILLQRILPAIGWSRRTPPAKI